MFGEGREREKPHSSPRENFQPSFSRWGKVDMGKTPSVMSADVRGELRSWTEPAIHGECKGNWCPFSTAAMPIPAAVRR